MESIHFEQLWEEGENSCDDSTTTDEILSELDIKWGVLKTVAKSGLSGTDRAKAIGLALGSLIKSLTYLSKIENINVYAALKESLKS